MALLERLATPAEVQRALGLLRRIAEAGGTAPHIGEVLVGQGTINDEQNQKLLDRMTEVEGAISDAQSGLHEVPRRLGRYEVLERIGRGGMGVVYKARQLNMDRVVALKILAAHLTRDRKYIKQFIREARAAGQINHPNIVGVHEVGQAEGHFFICMEYVEGRALSRELLARGRLPALEALDIARQVASGLSAAERRKIVHRDIKPDNIILTPRGDIKVTDLGLAKRLADVTSAGQSNWGCGTPYYMAPEQARNSSRVDIRSDIYALGSTLYHLTTGKLPFEGPSSVEVLMRAASDRLIPPAVLCPDVPVALSDLIERMMSRDPDGRPPSALALLGEIDAVRREMESSRGGRRRSRRSVRARAGGGLLGGSGPAALVQTAAWSLAALAVIGFAVQLAGRKKPPPEPAPRLTANGSTNGETGPEPPAANGGAARPENGGGRDEAEIRGLLGRLRKVLASEEPAAYARALAQCDARAEKAGKLAPVLRQLRSELAARMELLAGRELARHRHLADDALAWGRPGRALEFMEETARRWPGTAAAGSLADLRAALARRAARQVRELEGRFGELTAAESLDRAGELLGQVRGGSFAPCREWQAAAARRLAAARKAAAGRTAALGAESRLVGAELARAEAKMARWDFRGATGDLDAAVKKAPAGSRARLRLELAARRARNLLRFQRQMFKRLKEKKPPLADSAFRDNPLGLVITNAHYGGLVMVDQRGEGVLTLIAWGRFKPSELLSLARQVVSRRSGEDQLAMALLYMTARETAQAETYLAAAEKKSGMKAKTAVHRQELDFLASPDEESAAEELESAVRTLLGAGRPAEASARLGRLLVDRRRTAYVSARRDVLLKLVGEAERDCVLGGPFSARVRETLPGCLRLDYDFSKAGSGRDWKITEKGQTARLSWLPVFPGNFRAAFEISGAAQKTALTITPVMRGGAKRALGPLRLEAKGPKWAGRALSKAKGTEPSARTADKMELELRDGEVRWGTQSRAGRSALPRELLDGLASGRVTGWRLSLELALTTGRVTAARIDCRPGAAELKAIRSAREKAAADRLERAMKVVPELRGGDLDRFIAEYRDVGAKAAEAELERARLLKKAGRFKEARARLERFMVTYPSQSSIFPQARSMLEGISRAGSRR